MYLPGPRWYVPHTCLMEELYTLCRAGGSGCKGNGRDRARLDPDYASKVRVCPSTCTYAVRKPTAAMPSKARQKHPRAYARRRAVNLQTRNLELTRFSRVWR